MKKPIRTAVTVLAVAMLACAPSRSGPPRSSPAPTAAPSTENTADGVPAGLQAELDSLPEGDAASGERLFNQQPCHVCHADLQLAPALAELTTHAGTRRPGYPAEAYLYESIVEPRAYVVDGFDGGIMPENFKETLTSQDLADLVAFLLTAQ